ncbi:MAG: hypothetical protein ACTHN5_12070 [Phycisphaerae bacterium]
MGNQEPRQRATDRSLTSPIEDAGKRPTDLREPDAFGPVNIQENLRPAPQYDHTPRPEMAKRGDALPGPGQTSHGRE